MTLSELLEIDIRGKDCVVLGRAASGKTHVARLLSKKWGMPLLSTDDFRTGNFEEDLDALFEAIQGRKGGICIEGVLSYRLLRKGQETGLFAPDIVIECEVPEWVQAKVYREQRPDKSMAGVRSLNKGLLTIYNQWFFSMNIENQPTIIQLNNNWYD